MQIKVKTTGSFMVHDVFAGQTVLPGEEKSVYVTEFIRQKLAEGVLAEIGGEVEKPEKPKAGAGPTSGVASKK